MSFIKDISDLLRLSLCFLASIVILIAGFISYRFNEVHENTSVSPNFLKFIFKNELVPLEGIILGLFVPFLLIAGTHVINDYYDYENDMLNQRLDRPLVRGAISPQLAKIYAIAFYILAIIITIIEVISFNLHPLLILAALFFSVWGIGYNFIKKYGFLGNIWVSTGYVAPFLMGTLLIGLTTEWVVLNVAVLCFFIFFLALGREVLKDIMDIEGDLETGKRSVAIILGSRRTAIVAGLIYILGFCCGFSMLLIGFRNNLIFLVGFLIVCSLLSSTVILLIRNPTSENAVKGRKYTRWSLWWATALIFISSFFLV